MIKLDANSGVRTMDIWICLDETGPVFSLQGQCVVRPLSPSLENRHCVEVEQQKSVDSKKLKEQN